MVYRCSICGYVYDEEKEGKPFSALTSCPVCKQPPEKFEVVEAQKTGRDFGKTGYAADVC